MGAARAEVLGYFRNQVDRMDDPTYEANGWYIGSGAVERACKTVVGQRMKGSGVRRGEAGAHAACHVPGIVPERVQSVDRLLATAHRGLRQTTTNETHAYPPRTSNATKRFRTRPERQRPARSRPPRRTA